MIVGTRGLGDGTFASISYDGLITDRTAPVAEIAFPADASGRLLPPARYMLPHRC
jgi:hypothetical protein